MVSVNQNRIPVLSENIEFNKLKKVSLFSRIQNTGIT